MQWTGLNELREKYLHYFETKGHLRLGSFPLVPKDDPSLLLINSGMAPMKKWFLGQEEPPRHRVTTCQKCIRTPDIERVGITARHGCFFEMLGNFSFQDYFKKEVIPWAWEFLTKELEIPADKLYISVYQDDDEAYDIWTKSVGIPEDHMVRLGKEDNFWEHGSGPCGPCSEIYYDRGLKYGCGKPTCGVGCDCDRFMEIWNLVFSQYDADGKGNYELLAKPNIDTGMGLERLAVVMQDVNNLFEVDTVAAVLHHVERIAGKKYEENEKDDISIRVITDHIRATVFMASDGILPSNEGRGYVMRRLLRRAARHGRMLGINRPFLTELVDTVIESSEAGYPELREHEAYIKKVIGTEEANFARTIDAGMNILNNMIDRLEKAHQKLLSGMDAFKLNDTFGFPLDLTKEIAAEQVPRTLQDVDFAVANGNYAVEAGILDKVLVTEDASSEGAQTYPNVIAVREAYRRHGLEIERLHREPDDHLGLMLGFLSRLMAEEREAVEAGDMQQGAALADEQDAFLTEHVLPWLAPWRYAVEKYARTDFYRGVGAFVFGLIACYAERFGIRFDGKASAFKRRK